MGQATFASHLNIENHQAIITREVDGGTQTICLPLPVVMTTDLRLNEPRYTSLPNIIKAKKKPIEQKALSDLCVDTRARLTVLNIEEPQSRQPGIKVANVVELVSALKKTSCI